MTEPALEPLPAPDLIEPIVGFRQWRLAEDGLWSLYSDVRWPGPELRATCTEGDHNPGAAPMNECSCGIYACFDPCPRTAAAGTSDFVSGAVVVWGRVEVHATGLRAQYAQIVALERSALRREKRREIARVAEWLEVPVVPHHRLKPVASEHGLPIPVSLRPRLGEAVERTGAPVGLLPRMSLALVRAAHSLLS